MLNTLDDCAALIGLDWADQKHDLCLKAKGADKPEYSRLKHCPRAIDEWARALQQRFGGAPVAVCLEQRKGPVIHALLKYEFLVLIPVNPQTLARFRRAFKTSRAKDDPTDAALMVELLERHADKLCAWQADTPGVRQLQLLVQMRRTAIADRVRITNRLTAALKSYYPQPLSWFKDHDTVLFADFLLRWPQLDKAQRARSNILEKFFRDHNARYAKIIESRIEQIADSVALTEDPALITSYRLQVQHLARQLKLTLETITEYDQAIAKCFNQLPDASLFASLPGAGPQLAPRLLAAFGSDRSHWPQVQSFLQYTGIAPVTERSGKKSWVHWRFSCPTFVRQTFVEWAAQTITRSFWAKAYYEQQRAKGKPHQVAVRALAFKWIRILHRCWLDNKPYDEAQYLMALQRKGSPLVAGLGQAHDA